MKTFKILIIFIAAGLANSQTFDPNAYCKALASGYHPYPGTNDCTQYVKCFSNGVSMVGAVYTCMGTTLFNPTILLCQSGYICVPATTTVATTITKTVAPTTTTKTVAPTTTTTTVAPTVPTTTTVALTDSTTTQPATTESTTVSTTISDTTTTTSVAPFDANTFCATQAFGYYPHPSGCISYVYCYIFNDTMVGNIYECLGTTRFNPLLKLCQDGFTCDSTTIAVDSTTEASTTTTTTEATTDSTTNSETTTDSETTTEDTTVSDSTTTSIQETTTPVASFDANIFCSTQAYGYYAYPTGCISYVYCHVFNDTMVGSIYDCVGTTRFNPLLNLCQDGYTCDSTTTSNVIDSTTKASTISTTTVAPTDSTTVSDSTTSSIVVTTTSAVPFNANTFCAALASGNYAYPTGCISYVKCYIFNDIMVGNVYDCVDTTRFNPLLKYCQDGYTC